ncbi:ABC transporter permease subunit [Streptomyces sp. NPDC005438]|uniref:ABC transporter permease n=1 Tax=Streptomyces sp. NPDC005438 TaxID=3156880 RepID=UPI0033A6CAA8
MSSPQATPTQGASASIHDIGYRHYDGERKGTDYARRSLYTHSLRGAFGLGRAGKSKVLPMLLLGIICVPAAIVVAVAIFTKADSLPLEYGAYPTNLEPVITLFVAAQAPQAVSRDLRFRTMPLYFSRPMSRRDYVLAKYAALSSAVFLLTALPQVILYAGALLAKLGFVDQTEEFGRSLVLVALMSLLYSGLALLVAALTPRRGFGVAGVIALFLISSGVVAALQAIAWEQGDKGLISWLALGSPSSLVEGVKSGLLGFEASWLGPNPSAAMGMTYALVSLLLMAGCYGLLMLRYRKAGL